MDYPRGDVGFKLAAHHLVLTGRYPSMRAILNELGRTGRTKGRKCHGNGRECAMKADIFELYNIKPFTGYMGRSHRKDWENWLHNSFDPETKQNRPTPFTYERGKGGSLVLTEDGRRKQRGW